MRQSAPGTIEAGKGCVKTGSAHPASTRIAVASLAAASESFGRKLPAFARSLGEQVKAVEHSIMSETGDEMGLCLGPMRVIPAVGAPLLFPD
jgi:hypothetical protein